MQEKLYKPFTFDLDAQIKMEMLKIESQNAIDNAIWNCKKIVSIIDKNFGQTGNHKESLKKLEAK